MASLKHGASVTSCCFVEAIIDDAERRGGGDYWDDWAWRGIGEFPLRVVILIVSSGAAEIWHCVDLLEVRRTALTETWISGETWHGTDSLLIVRWTTVVETSITAVETPNVVQLVI